MSYLTKIRRTQPPPVAPPPRTPAKKSTTKRPSRFEIRLPFGRTAVKSRVLTAFTRQLATLADAGLPLLRGLTVLRNQEKQPVLHDALGKIAVAVEAGSTFSEALAQHPGIFSRLYVNMVRAGEVSGKLHLTLARLSEFQEKAQRLKNKVTAALVYPSVVIFVAVAIVSFLMAFVVPKFQEIFSSLMDGGKLPWLTQWVMSIGDFVHHRFGVIAGLVAVVVITLKIIVRTERGRLLYDTLTLHAPVVGPLIRKINIARLTRTLGTLLSSGVPILQALNIVRETVTNTLVAKAVLQIHDAVKEGESIAHPMETCRIFPPMVISMVEVGEHTGALPDMLTKVADVYDDEVDNAVGALTSLLEPVMIVCLALVVGTIVIALFLPLIQIITDFGR